MCELHFAALLQVQSGDKRFLIQILHTDITVAVIRKSCFLLIAMAAFLVSSVDWAWPAAMRSVEGISTFETGKVPVAEIHVAEKGSDRTGDGSSVSPYGSIGRAVRDAVPGSAIRVHAGNYSGGTYVVGLSGTEANPIWIGGVPGEAKPVFDGGDVGLYFSRVRYLIVHDIAIQNASFNGINTDDGGEFADPDATRYVIFRDLDVSDIGGSGNQDCLKLSGVDDYFVLSSVFARCGGGISGSGIDQVGCHNGHIQGNYFEAMSGNSVQTKGGSESIRIHANTVVDGGLRAFNIGGSTGFEYFRPPLSTTGLNFEARNIKVTANVIVGSEAPLAFVGAVDSVAANNTIISPTSRWLLRILQETISNGGYTFLASADNRVTNNLFYFNRSALSVHVNIGSNTDPSSFVFANNLWYAHDNPSQSRPKLPVIETNGIVAQDPLLAAPESRDYHPLSGSPAISGGQLDVGVTEDFDGLVYNNPPSIGAFEVKPGRFDDVPPDY